MSLSGAVLRWYLGGKGFSMITRISAAKQICGVPQVSILRAFSIQISCATLDTFLTNAIIQAIPRATYLAAMAPLIQCVSDKQQSTLGLNLVLTHRSLGLIR